HPQRERRGGRDFTGRAVYSSRPPAPMRRKKRLERDRTNGGAGPGDRALPAGPCPRGAPQRLRAVQRVPGGCRAAGARRTDLHGRQRGERVLRVGQLRRAGGGGKGGVRGRPGVHRHRGGGAGGRRLLLALRRLPAGDARVRAGDGAGDARRRRLARRAHRRPPPGRVRAGAPGGAREDGVSDLGVVALIERKKRGGELSEAELRALLEGYVAGDVPDYQLAAWLMAVCWRGMSEAETLAMTRAMVASGEVLDWEGIGRPTVDKHSTGGVGDKTSIVLVPLM